jgi:lipopolysaccharide transport system ATP-binding protein
MFSEPGNPVATPNGAPVVTTTGLGKCYHIYPRPQDRLRQFFAREGKRYYREFWALRDVDLQVFHGETLGIVGRNGAGKSTLLQLIAGTLKPTTGTVQIDGRVTALLELGSGFHQDFTGRENVFLAGAILGLDREQMNERMERIEAFADIGDFLDRPVKTYSKGMFARLSFSVYANLDPEVFIVDEALAVGDARFRHKCMYRFRQMQDQGVAILYVSHDAASMKHMCSRVAWIDRGKLVQVGDPSVVVDAYLNDLFHGSTRGPSNAAGARSDEGIRGDDDLGSRECSFVAAELLDAKGNRTDHLTAGDECELRLAVRNESLDPKGDPMLVGFSVSNLRGIAITGTHTLANKVRLTTPAPGERLTVHFRFKLPILAPGSYAISVTTTTLDAAGQTHLCHLVPNAITFQTSHTEKVFGLLGLECSIEVD